MIDAEACKISPTESLSFKSGTADWINETIKKKRIRQGSVISLYSEIQEDDNDLIPFVLETKYDPRAKRLGNYSKARALFLISTSQLANHNHN